MKDVKLYLVFRTENNKTHNLIIDSPKENLDGNEVKEAMDQILQKGVFHIPEKGQLLSIEEARYVERTITPVEFA